MLSPTAPRRRPTLRFAVYSYTLCLTSSRPGHAIYDALTNQPKYIDSITRTKPSSFEQCSALYRHAWPEERDPRRSGRCHWSAICQDVFRRVPLHGWRRPQSRYSMKGFARLGGTLEENAVNESATTAIVTELTMSMYGPCVEMAMNSPSCEKLRPVIA